MAAHAAPGTVNYSYDDVGRLRNANYGCAATAYTLDAPGNRASVQATTSSTLQFGAATYSVSEANASVTISVTRGCNTSAATSVSYTIGGTAVQTTDYSISGTLSWAAGDATAKSLTLTTVDNSVYAANKTVILTLSAPTGGATIGTPGATTVTITENDPQPIPGAVQFTASTLSVSEGTANAQFTVTRAGAGGGVPAASVVCTPANGTAMGGSDFTASAQTINWAANDVSNKTCSIPILNDSTFENSETFTVALSSPTGGMTLGSPTSATVTVTDNDATSLSIANASVNESAGTVTLTVTKTGASSFTHAVNYATTVGSASAADYTAVSGTLTFAPADMSKTITVSIASDTIYEGNETFTLNLSSPTNGATLGASTSTVTILDDEAAPSFSINSIFVNEVDGTATLTVTKTGGTAFTHNVNYASANGSAIAGADYTAVSGTLAFTSAETSKTIVVPITNDSVYEGNDTFTVNLSTPTNSAVIGTGTGTVTIAPDNDAAPILSFSQATVNESAGSLTVTVTKGGATDLTHQVNYATNGGTATSGVDFMPVSGTLTFAPGDTTKSVVITIVNDNIYEGTEGFAFVISGATNGALAIQGPPGGAITLEDDDLPPVPGTLSISAVSATAVGESFAAGNIVVTLARTGASGAFGPASVVCATANGTAVAGSDYTAVSQTVSWAAGDSSPKTCTVPIIDDSNFELNCYANLPGEQPPMICTRDEDFSIYFSGASGASWTGGTYLIITIGDDDSPM